MSTSVAAVPAVPRPLPGRRYDRVFFSIMCLLVLASVLLGFARTYFLAGTIHAPLPSKTIHIHAIVFSSWIILLIVQQGLVVGRRLDLHKKLGLAGFALACLVVVMGLLAAKDLLIRGVSPVPVLPIRTFFMVPVSDMFVFATLIYFGWALRTNGAAHKRLMIIATIAMLDAAINRFPFAWVHNPHLVDLTSYVLLLLMVLYDLWSTHKVNKATIYASLFVIVVQQIRIPIAFSHPWLRFADLVAGKI